MIKPDYVNTSSAETTEVMRGTTSDANQSAASYCQLESSNVEAPQPPAVYDRLTRHEYVND